MELLGIEDRSKEEIVQNISEISKYEKEKIGKEIYQRGFVTIICGMIVLAGQLSAALIFAQNEVPGAGILCTSGMMCFTGLMIANGLYTISHAKKLRNESIPDGLYYEHIRNSPPGIFYYIGFSLLEFKEI